jgi:hypothetical protein
MGTRYRIQSVVLSASIGRHGDALRMKDSLKIQYRCEYASALVSFEFASTQSEEKRPQNEANDGWCTSCKLG